MQLSKCLLPLLLCPLLSTSALAAAPHYKATLLASGNSSNTVINNDGLVAGVLHDQVDNTLHAYLWKDGVYTMLDTPINRVAAISADGKVAGEAIDYNPEDFLARPAVYANGSTTMVPAPIAPLDHYNYLSAVNSAGKVAGTQYTNIEGHAYTSVNGVSTLLGGLGGARSYAGGMNEAGVVVGAAETADGSFHAFLNDGSGMVDLGTMSGGRWTQATGINDAGVIIGNDIAAIPGSDYRAFIYQDGVMQPLGTFEPGARSLATAINNLGQVVGYGAFSFLVSEGVTYNLDSFLPAGSGLHMETAWDINDSGQITGSACTTSGVCSAVLLSPVPEPASGLMLLAGLALLHRLRRTA
ncbi:hypothetical protein LJR289_004686 [Pseudoduganella sp. LjRoot289]|uniref:hypothetical protein n=1 Tax=Pseudoduganella sp. LjRoot289 TaxID=3342314 RepID=UPI003ECE46AA